MRIATFSLLSGIALFWTFSCGLDPVESNLSVTTDSVMGITTNSATTGGNVSDDGGSAVTERGVCWGTAQNPTLLNAKTSDGTGTGDFSSSITGLVANTTYYVRAYASNNNGTAYGNQQSFTTASVQAGPMACFSYTTGNNGLAPSIVNFNAACSQSVLSYNWNFGDPSSGSNNSAVGVSASHTYSAPGDYAVTLSAIGANGSDDSTIIVKITTDKFYKTIPMASSVLVKGVLQTTDGGYIVAGDYYGSGPNGLDDIFMARFDKNGDMMSGFPVFFGGTNSDHCYDVELTADGNSVMIVGEVDKKGYWIKTNLSGVKIDGPEYYSSSPSGTWGQNIQAIKQLPNGNIKMIGYADISSSNYAVFNVQTNSSGSPNVALTFQIQSGSSYGSDLDITSTGRIAITGNYYGSVGGSKAFYMVSSTTGSMLANGFETTLWDGFGRSIISVSNDNGFVVIGSDGGDLRIVRRESSSNFDRTFTIGSFSNKDYITETTDGTFAALTTKQDAGGKWHFYFIRLDAAGNDIAGFPKLIGSNTISEYAQGIASTTDGGVIIAGQSDGGIVLIKTDKDGNYE